MPIEMKLWRLGGGDRPLPVSSSSLAEEKRLEDVLEHEVDLLGLDVMIIGRQVPTAYGKVVDLLALNGDGDLYVIELKRDRTPRDIVAQVLDYASWAKDLSREELVEIFAKYRPGQDLDGAFADHFGGGSPETLNESHRLVIVASELDSATERIVDYLADEYKVAINVVFFRHFLDGDREYLARTWLMDPETAEVTTGSTKRVQHPWNGRDHFVNVTEDDQRRWADCRRYGFVSGGGGPRWRQAMDRLDIGSRVFAYIPGPIGYVGVGEVTHEAIPVREFTVEADGTTVPILEAKTAAPAMDRNVDDLETCEYLVRVNWLRTVDKEAAIWDKDMFANQNATCRLTQPHTLKVLYDTFGLTDG